MEGTCKVMTLGTCKCEASGFGSESSDVVLNPFIFLLTLQRTKHSFNLNLERGVGTDVALIEPI